MRIKNLFFLLISSLIWLVAFQTYAGNLTGNFKHLRKDLNIPEHCYPLGFDNFKNIPNLGPASNDHLVTIGINHSMEHGFTNEYQMLREDAAILFDIFGSFAKTNASSIRSYGTASPEERIQIAAGLDPILQNKLNNDLRSKLIAKLGSPNHPDFNRRLVDLQLHAKRISERYLDMGMLFMHEGDVLEVLWPYAINIDQKDFNSLYPENEYFFTGGLEYFEKTGQTIGELDILVGKNDTCEILIVGEAKLGVDAVSHAKSQLARLVTFLNNNGMLMESLLPALLPSGM